MFLPSRVVAVVVAVAVAVVVVVVVVVAVVVLVVALIDRAICANCPKREGLQSRRIGGLG